MIYLHVILICNIFENQPQFKNAELIFSENLDGLEIKFADSVSVEVIVGVIWAT